MLHVLYLVHDLADPSVRRRVIMLQAGGAKVTLAGFRRGKLADGLDAFQPVELGVTGDGRFGQRLAAVARAAVRLGTLLRGRSRPDVIVGRTLEMLALANRAGAIHGGDIPIVYESLDIHRLLLREDAVGRAMRGAERFFGRRAGLVLTSSPAFIREYFQAYGQLKAPVMLLENKVLELDETTSQAGFDTVVPLPGRPWKIGWYGALRCRKSLALLADFTRRMEGRFEVVLRGKPAYSEFDDFDGFVAREPYLRFDGPYRNPEDLAGIYGQVHFAWAIDFFEEGLNSRWLLPNRLYESCRHGAVPIAMSDTETGRFLAARGLGLRLPEPTAEALIQLLGDIDAERYASLRTRVESHDPAAWVCGRKDCRELVLRLERLAGKTMTDATRKAA